MDTYPRRENGITVRYLAQTIIKDSAPGKQLGISKFIDSLVNHHNVDKKEFKNLDYYFFLHLEDYGVEDKSEIDFILWNEKVILPVEVKAFTDANSPDVKKEIIRNYLHIDALKTKSKFDFNQRQKIYPVLLYSESYQNWKHGINSGANYFNKNFIYKKGRDQTRDLDKWELGNYPIPKKYFESPEFDKNRRTINENLFFTTWENIYNIHKELNKKNIFSEKIKELKKIKDNFQDKNGIPLIKLIGINE